MNTFSRLLLLGGALFTCLPAHAQVHVEQKQLQKGIFSPPKCDGDGCLCEADIKYPIITGMENTRAEETLNASIRKSAEQLECQGTAAKATGKGDNFSIWHGYEVTFQSPSILGLKFTDWAYEGGAHSNSQIEGMIIDLRTGKVLAVDDIFGRHNIAAINKVIYDTLAPKAEGVFIDEVNSRKDSFIKNGKCGGCTVIMGKNGISVQFQAYEVAPFADGNPSVPIPAKYVVYSGLSPSPK